MPVKQPSPQSTGHGRQIGSDGSGVEFGDLASWFGIDMYVGFMRR